MNIRITRVFPVKGHEQVWLEVELVADDLTPKARELLRKYANKENTEFYDVYKAMRSIDEQLAKKYGKNWYEKVKNLQICYRTWYGKEKCVEDDLLRAYYNLKKLRENIEKEMNNILIELKKEIRKAFCESHE